MTHDGHIIKLILENFPICREPCNLSTDLICTHLCIDTCNTLKGTYRFSSAVVSYVVVNRILYL